MNKAGTRTIKTERLILRRFTIRDAEGMYHNWASDPAVTEFLTWPTHTSVDVTKDLLTAWISHYEEGDYFNWVLEYKETGAVIGNISVVHLREEISACEIGYCMGKAYWGKGIMPEALRAVIDYLFKEADMNRICACHDVNNPKSGRVMDKAGMKVEGTLRAASKNNKGICNVTYHSIIRSDLEK